MWVVIMIRDLIIYLMDLRSMVSFLILVEWLVRIINISLYKTMVNASVALILINTTMEKL
jgi:hypothetical protein